MKICEHLQKSLQTFFSCEVLPPIKGNSLKEVWETLDILQEFQPIFIDVTYHRQQKEFSRKRAGTLGTCSAILQKYKIPTVPHIVCGGMNIYDIENMLLDFYFMGVENVLALQGDKLHSDPYFIPSPNGHTYAMDLLEQIVRMKNGCYLHEVVAKEQPDFCVGVAGYPEKHLLAPSFDFDLDILLKKVRLGANYIVTQMFFDNKKYFSFVEKCRNLGIHIPVLPGIKPITSKKQLESLPTSFGISIPEALEKEIKQAKDDAQIREIGVSWCIEQCRELQKNSVPCLHFYTMNKAEMILPVLKAIF